MLIHATCIRQVCKSNVPELKQTISDNVNEYFEKLYRIQFHGPSKRVRNDFRSQI